MMAASGSYFQQMRYCTWSLLILSLIQLTCGASDEKMSVTVAGGGTATETSFLHSGPAADTPEQAYLHLLMKQQYEKDKMDLMKTGLTDEMKKNKNKIEATLIGEPATRKGRGKKGDKKMQMLYLGLMYIKSVIQMVMMAMGQVLQFKSVMISLVSVLIQLGQFAFKVKAFLNNHQKQHMQVHVPAAAPPHMEYHEKYPPSSGYPYPPSNSQSWR